MVIIYNYESITFGYIYSGKTIENTYPENDNYSLILCKNEVWIIVYILFSERGPFKFWV